jgi:hypothetical protein
MDEEMIKFISTFVKDAKEWILDSLENDDPIPSIVDRADVLIALLEVKIS